MPALSQIGGANWDPAIADKENAPAKQTTPEAVGKIKTKLSPSWLFDAAILTTPVDLSALVDLSMSSPADVLNEVIYGCTGIIAPCVSRRAVFYPPPRVDRSGSSTEWWTKC